MRLPTTFSLWFQNCHRFFQVMFTNSFGFSHKEILRMMYHIISVKAFQASVKAFQAFLTEGLLLPLLLLSFE